MSGRDQTIGWYLVGLAIVVVMAGLVLACQPVQCP